MKSLIRRLIRETQQASVLADRDQRRFDFEPLFIYFHYKPTHRHLHNVKGLKMITKQVHLQLIMISM